MSQNPLTEKKRLVSLREAAAFADCHPRTIRRRIAAGNLRGYRIGSRLIKVDMAEVEALLDPIQAAEVSQ